jgi:hypothetical protein
VFLHIQILGLNLLAEVGIGFRVHNDELLTVKILDICALCMEELKM